MQGIAKSTGRSGLAWSLATNTLAIGARKNMCIRYIPNDIFDTDAIRRGVFGLLIQEKSRNAPNEAQSTLGVQNSHDHSSKGVSII